MEPEDETPRRKGAWARRASDLSLTCKICGERARTAEEWQLLEATQRCSACQKKPPSEATL